MFSVPWHILITVWRGRRHRHVRHRVGLTLTAYLTHGGSPMPTPVQLVGTIGDKNFPLGTPAPTFYRISLVGPDARQQDFQAPQTSITATFDNVGDGSYTTQLMSVAADGTLVDAVNGPGFTITSGPQTVVLQVGTQLLGGPTTPPPQAG